MQIFSCPMRGPRVAFTLTEVLVAVGVVGVLFVSLYLAFSAGFSMVRITRENQAATQVMMQRAETLRLYTWTQFTNATFFQTNFTEDATATLGTKYCGNIRLTTPSYLGTPSYLNDMRSVVISVRWTNTFGKPMPHYREMQTQVAKNGLGNYASGN
jgi:prepilin-type N-terminal cleavage/methylation domain-containing protein